MPGDEVDALLGSAGAITLASGARATKEDLLAQLDKIRTDGYAVSVSERLFGIVSVTAPVRTVDGTLVAVLGVTGPTDTLTEARIQHLVPEVRRAATTLGTRVPTTG